ncbi:MAG: hypothetical protein MZV49_06260 [Rhodopseudomonas palustris]|nr:hypothetical protein [Rhodopseudomonas palustris]
MTGTAPTAKSKFPATFWTANTIELFERAAYYAMASFVVIYLKETLGMSPAFATFLNGSLLWGLIYFLPIVSGTLADKYGFKRSLVVAFVLLSLGYLVMGNVQSFWPDRGGGRGRRLHHPGRAGHRPHRPGRLDRQALHRRHGPEDRRACAPPWASASSTWSSTSARSPAAASPISSRTSLRHPGHLLPTWPPPSPSSACSIVALRLPRAAVRPRRQEGRPGRAEEDAGPGAAGHRHRPGQLSSSSSSWSSSACSGSSTSSSTTSCRLFLRWVDPDAPDGALYPGQPDHDRLLPAPHHPAGQEMDAGRARSCSASWSPPSACSSTSCRPVLFADISPKVALLRSAAVQSCPSPASS